MRRTRTSHTLARIGTGAVVAALAAAGSAAAASAPTLGPLTVLHAGQKSPVAVGGGPHQGAKIPKGTELRRWLVTLHGPSKTPVRLSCGAGRVRNLSLQDPGKIGLVVPSTSRYGHHTIQVRFYAAPRAGADSARGSVYALCKTA